MASSSIQDKITMFYSGVLPKYVKVLSDGVLTSTKLLAELKNRKMVRYGEGGDGVEFKVLLTAGSYGGSTTDEGTREYKQVGAPETARDVMRPYSFGGFISNFKLDRFNAADNSQKLLRYLENSIELLKQDASNRLANHSYSSTALTGDNGTNINSLADIVKASGTLHNIDPTTYTAWVAKSKTSTNFEQVNTAKNVANGVLDMREIYYDCAGAEQEKAEMKFKSEVGTGLSFPTFAMTTSSIHQKIRNITDARALYTSKESFSMYDSGGIPYENGCTIYWDPKCTSGKIYWLNDMALELWSVYNDLLVPSSDSPKTNQNPYAITYLLIGQLQMLTRYRWLNGVQTVSS